MTPYGKSANAETTPPDSLRGPGLAELAVSPRAKADLRDLLRDRIRLKAALADTVAVLEAAALDTASRYRQALADAESELWRAGLALEAARAKERTVLDKIAFPAGVLVGCLVAGLTIRYVVAP